MDRRPIKFNKSGKYNLDFIDWNNEGERVGEIACKIENGEPVSDPEEEARVRKHMELDDIKDLCVSIDLLDVVYPLCFIREETSEYLVVDNTDENGFEKVVIIPKDNILAVKVVYQQDIEMLDESEKKDLVMFR